VHRNVSGSPEKRTVLEANGAGVALLDLESDGDLDVVFAQGVSSLGKLMYVRGADLVVFANDGQGRFEPRAGPGLSGWWTGLATGDVNGDGRTDLVAGAYGDLALLLQDTGGSLVRTGTDLTPEPHANAPLWTTSLALFDADRDGALDLYVGRYLDLDPLAPPEGQLGEGALALPCWWQGHEVFCGPRGLPAQLDAVYRGDGRGGFTEHTVEWLPDLRPAYTLGVAPFDADGDGDTDLAVANDSVANSLWINALAEGPGVFLERGLSAGIALSADGEAEAGMGVAVGDVNRDGAFDLVVTNFSGEPTQLYFGAPVGFTCESYRLGLANATRRLLSWGVHLVDFDGDGRLELFTANGHVYPQADLPGTGTRYRQPDTLFRLGERVLPYEVRSASVFDAEEGTRGSAVGDVDGDGAPDLVLARIDAPAALGINHLDPGASRLLVRCLGPRSNREDPPGRFRTPPDGKGARVVVVPAFPPGTAAEDEFALLAEVQTAQGYQSASSEWLHFGLGDLQGYASITVLWPSGRREVLPAGAARRRLTLREGDGIVHEQELP